MPYCRAIGVIETPFEAPADTPRQGWLTDAEGEIEVFPEFQPGLKGIRAGQSLDVVWFAHLADRTVLELNDEAKRGVFATRSQHRPNPVCISRCTVQALAQNRLRVSGVDMADRTPLIDLKVPLRRIND